MIAIQNNQVGQFACLTTQGLNDGDCTTPSAMQCPDGS